MGSNKRVCFLKVLADVCHGFGTHRDEGKVPVHEFKITKKQAHARAVHLLSTPASTPGNPTLILPVVDGDAEQGGGLVKASCRQRLRIGLWL